MRLRWGPRREWIEVFGLSVDIYVMRSLGAGTALCFLPEPAYLIVTYCNSLLPTLPGVLGYQAAFPRFLIENFLSAFLPLLPSHTPLIHALASPKRDG